MTLPGKGIGSNIKQRSIGSRDDATDVVGREFWIERLDNFVASLLAGNSVGATVRFAKNDVDRAEVVVISRDKRNQEARTELASRKFRDRSESRTGHHGRRFCVVLLFGFVAILGFL